MVSNFLTDFLATVTERPHGFVASAIEAGFLLQLKALFCDMRSAANSLVLIEFPLVLDVDDRCSRRPQRRYAGSAPPLLLGSTFAGTALNLQRM